MFSPCEIQDIPARPTMTIRTHCPVQDLPQVIGNAYAEIAGYMGEMGTHPAGGPFVIYYNMDMQNLEVEIGFPSDRAFPGKGGVQPGEFPGCRAATCVYTGPYPEMTAAYEALTRCIQESGLEATGVAIEEYFNSPMEVAPEELKTRIILPVKM